MKHLSAKSHPIRASQEATHRAGPIPPHWPSYTGVSQFVGISPNGRVTVFVDPTLGTQGLKNAQDLIDDANRIVSANDALFGTAGGPVSVIVFALGGKTDGTGGADHGGCDYNIGAAIEVCAAFGSPDRVSALFEAELSECSMGGNLCGVSTGEALSRWCAAEIGKNALSDFSTAPSWAKNGMPDWVNRTFYGNQDVPGDQDPNSTGCGMAFLSWLRSQGHQLGAIAQEMVSLGESGTLAQLYAGVTNDNASNAWPRFIAAVRALPGGVTSDDPFGGTSLMDVPLLNVALAAKVFSSILADISAGKAENEILTNVRTLIGVPPSAKSRGGSHRLISVSDQI